MQGSETESPISICSVVNQRVMWEKLKNIVPFIAAGVSTLAIVVIVSIAPFNWANNLAGDVARLESKVDAIDRDVVELRQDMNNRFDKLEAEIKVSRNEIIAVIQGHEHDQSGKTVFYKVP